MPRKIPHRKAISLFCVLFLLSLVAIALDQHNSVMSSTCPICHTKICINGNVASFDLDVHFVYTYYRLAKQQFDVIMPISQPLEGRAPPQYFLS